MLRALTSKPHLGRTPYHCYRHISRRPRRLFQTRRSSLNFLPENLDHHLEIWGKLGEGNYGVVYRANSSDPSDPSTVALKILKLDKKSGKPLARPDFEWLVGTQIDSPYVVKTHEYGWGNFQGNRHPYLTMNLVRGFDLSRVLKTDFSCLGISFLSIRWRAMLRQLLHGLDAIHQAGFLHMDIKPENVVIDSSQQITTIDLGGCTNRRNPRVISVTTKYAAPEVRLSLLDEIGPWSDLYSVGTLLALFRQRYFPHGKSLQPMIDALTSKEIDKRPQTAQKAIEMLKKL